MTDRRRLCSTGSEAVVRECLLAQARHAVEARIDILQIRERDMDARHLSTIVSQIVAMARGTATRVIVNDRIDVALACAAAGVHLRADSVTPAAVRSMAPDGFLVGRSVHTVSDVEAAGPDVDYLIAGPVWETRSKPTGHRVLGLDGLARMVAVARAPVLAIGGMTIGTVPAILATGAAGIAAIGLFMTPPDPRNARPCGAMPLAELVTLARAKADAPG